MLCIILYSSFHFISLLLILVIINVAFYLNSDCFPIRSAGAGCMLGGGGEEGGRGGGGGRGGFIGSHLENKVAFFFLSKRPNRPLTPGGPGPRWA